MLISSYVCSGWIRASCSPSENKKTCFASAGGVGWPLWLQADPLAGRQQAGRLLLLEWRAGSLAACFLQLSKHGKPGRKPTVCPRAPAESLSQQSNNGLDGLAGRWRGSPLRPCFYNDRQTQVAGQGAGTAVPYTPTSVLFSTFLNIVACLRGQGKQQLQEASLGCSGVLSSWRQQSWKKGPERD